MDLATRECVVGLDIGSSAVKMAQFSLEGGKLSLVRADLIELAAPADETLREKELVSAIRAITRGVDPRRCKVIAAINCPRTAVKKVTAPYMPRGELRQAVQLQAKAYFPFSVDDSVLDFEVLGDVVDKGVRKYRLVVGACPATTVNSSILILAKAGIKPSSLIPTSYALQKAVEASGGNDDAARCFIDIGQSHTELIISKDTQPVFSRKIPLAGEDFTRAMTDTLVSDSGRTQLSMAQAEKIKREAGIPAENESKIINGLVSSAQILSMLRMPLDQFAGEISRSLDYYREETDGGTVESVTIFGGGASLSGLTKYLTETLGVEVKLGDPLKSLSAQKGAISETALAAPHRMELAIGAALTEAKGLNLLPSEIKDATKRTVARGTVEAAVTAIVLTAALLYIGMGIKISNFETRIAVAKQELSALAPQIKRAEAVVLANKVLADEPQWEDVLKELSNLIPDYIHIEEIKMENRIITIQGVASSNDAEQAIANFVLTLENGLFANVKLVSTRDLEQGAEFELKCWVDYEAG
jgi:type IV pilus assembly protein PilM